MTDTIEHQVLLDAVTTVDSKIDKVARDLEIHMSEGHALYVGRAEVDSSLRKINDSVAEWIRESREEKEQNREQDEILAAVVLGELKHDYDGIPYREGGIQEIVTAYYQAGGLKFKFPWIKILAIVAPSVTAIVIALLQIASNQNST